MNSDQEKKDTPSSELEQVTKIDHFDITPATDPLKAEVQEEAKKVTKVEKTAAEDDENEDQVGENWTQEVSTFDDMCLRDELLRGIYAYGFKEPSPIQQKAVMPLIQGKDTIAQA